MNCLFALVVVGGLVLPSKPMIVAGEDAILLQELQDSLNKRTDWNSRIKVSNVECELLTPPKKGEEHIYQYVITFVDEGATDPERKSWKVGSLVFVKTLERYVDLNDVVIDNPRLRVLNEFKNSNLYLLYPWKKNPFRK